MPHEPTQLSPPLGSLASPAPAQAPAVTEQEAVPAPQGLYDYLSGIQQIVRRQVPPAWVRAEISQVSARGGNTYIELVEHDANGQIIAKVRSVIWRHAAPNVIAKFEQGAGTSLAADIKVMVHVRAELHPQYGMSLVVGDIDPTYTLGDMEAKLRQIRQHLQDAGLYDRNRSLPQPGEFTRVAVIAPAEAAGLGDFRREADLLEAHGLCAFDYELATFQGKEAPQSVYAAMRSLWDNHQVAPYDALVIIRGGGARADLQWLNDQRLAEAVCRIRIPVFTGIGHERDNTILDEVATRFDTPLQGDPTHRRDHHPQRRAGRGGLEVHRGGGLPEGDAGAAGNRGVDPPGRRVGAWASSAGPGAGRSNPCGHRAAGADTPAPVDVQGAGSPGGHGAPCTAGAGPGRAGSRAPPFGRDDAGAARDGRCAHAARRAGAWCSRARPAPGAGCRPAGVWPGRGCPRSRQAGTRPGHGRRRSPAGRSRARRASGAGGAREDRGGLSRHHRGPSPKECARTRLRPRAGCRWACPDPGGTGAPEK